MLPGREALTHSKPLTWSQLLEVGLGELNLHPEELYEYSMDEFVIAVQGSRKRDIDQWRHTRALGYMMVLPHMKNKISQEKLWPLPGDKGFEKKKKIAAMSKEERKEIISRIREQLKADGLITDN